MNSETLRMTNATIRQQIMATHAIARANAGWRPWLATMLVYAAAFIVVKALS